MTRTFSTGSVKSATPTATSRVAATARRMAEGHESAMDASSLLRQGLSLPQSSPPSPPSAPSAQPPALPRARSPTAAPARFANPRDLPCPPPFTLRFRTARSLASTRARRRSSWWMWRWIWRAGGGAPSSTRWRCVCVWVRFFRPFFPVGRTEGGGGERAFASQFARWHAAPSFHLPCRLPRRAPTDVKRRDPAGSSCDRVESGRWVLKQTRG